ncbi:MAG: sulfate permease [Aestuariivirgaceae bacterium]|nr:sulfate permease [Aestuariivirgaceae bacterium]
MPPLKQILPFLDWARSYTRASATNDLVAAMIVTIMLVPQSLAYAMLAGLPPQAGLYASILPLVAYALFGSSRTLAVGPVAVVSLMTAATISPFAAAGTAAYAEAAIVLALLSGMFLALLAFLRLGFLSNFLSHPVISGFISASGILIATSQLKHVAGIKIEGGTLPEILWGLVSGMGQANGWTLAIGISSVLFLFWVRRGLKPLLVGMGFGARSADMLAKAGPLIAIFASTLAVMLFHFTDKGVKIVGVIPAGLPPFAWPSFNPQLWVQLLPSAILLSLVGFVESVSVAQTLAAKRRQRTDANQELLALGAANVASGLSGGFPVTGGFARSIVNFDAGAETPLAGVFTAAGILVATLYLTPLFQFLPQAVLAATIIVAVLSLVDVAAMKRTWNYSKADFAAMAATVLCVLGIGVEAGITAGVSLSVLLFLWRSSRPHIAVVGQVPGTEHFRNVDRHDVLTSPDLLTVRVDESLYFANARHLEDTIYDQALAQGGVQNVVLMCSAVNMIDASALESLESLNARLRAAGIGFHLSEVKGPVMDSLQRSDFFEHFAGRVFLSQYEAVQALTAKPAKARARKTGKAETQTHGA